MRNHNAQFENDLKKHVLSMYNLPDGITDWRSHDRVGPDDFVHYFARNDEDYALVWSDHPNETFIHEENLPPVKLKNGDSEWLHIEAGELKGYYSLYHDVNGPIGK